MSYANVLSSFANAAVNSYVSPRYESRQSRAFRPPAQPADPAFSIWFPIFAGHIGYGLLASEDQSNEASFWNHIIAVSGLTYASTLVSNRFYSMAGAMAAMTYASYKYRKALPESSSVGSRAVRFAAEVGVGWLAAADTVIVAKDARRALGRPLTHREKDVTGLLQTAVATGAAVAANRVLGWRGVSVAAAWALGAVALDKRSERHVRAIAGVAAAGVLADLAFSAFGSSQTKAKEMAAAADFAESEVVIVEDTFIPPNIIMEEVTTVRI